jgi:hypothetical protein
MECVMLRKCLVTALSSCLLVGASAATAQAAQQSPEKYMILMDDQFVGNTRLQDFISWKTRKGYEVSVVTTSMINANGAPSHAEIVGYMHALTTEQYPRYLLIIGDADAANGVTAYKFQSTGVPVEYSQLFAYPQHYSDACITSKLSGCDAGLPLPSVFAGRLPARNSSELTIMLNKVLLMDRTPPDPATSAMYNQVVVAGDIEPIKDTANNLYIDRASYAELQDAAATYFQQGGDGSSYQVSLGLVDASTTPQGTPVPAGSSIYWNQGLTRLWKDAPAADRVIPARVLSRYFTGATADDDALQVVVDRINAGAALVQYVDHGGPAGWEHPKLVASDIPNVLHNGNNLPLVVSDACETGIYYPPTGDSNLYQGDVFVRSLLTHSNGGAYAVIGATDMVGTTGITHGIWMAFLRNYREWLANSTNPAYWSDLAAPDTQAIGMNAGEATRLGQMLYFAKWYTGGDNTYHLFGDPEAFVVLHPPLRQTVTYPKRMAPGPSRSITVYTGETGSKVSLYSQALGVRVVGVTENGTVTLPVAAGAAGTINVTVTRYERMPYEGTLTVTSDIPKGDVDANGTVDIVDALKIAQYYTGLPVYDLIPEAADVNCDGAVTIVDALMVAQKYVGVLPAFPC